MLIGKKLLSFCHISNSFRSLKLHRNIGTMKSEYISEITSFIPTLTPSLHKGQCGRIGVIGGSLEYTGAPYFSAITALKVGADLVHVFCCKQAAPVIKSYSPEQIVHPLLDEENALEKIKPWLDLLHALVIGPGLGREIDILKTVASLIGHCNRMEKPLPLVIDADGLFLITERLDLIKSYKAPVILTPNSMELERLSNKYQLVGRDCSSYGTLASELNVVLVKKGETDIIHNGLCLNMLGLEPIVGITECKHVGSNRRCGGQGDLLSGSLAVFLAWAHLKKLSEGDIHESISNKINENIIQTWKNSFFKYSLASYAACCLTKECSRLAFEKSGRSMTTSDMIGEIHTAFVNLFNC